MPYLVQSEDQVPGVPTWYASTCTECAAGCGLHVKTREGRAIKLEGNPDHPVNRGKLCSRGQASLQGLYNPGRIRTPLLRNGDSFSEISWDDAIARLAAEVTKAAGRVAVLSGAAPGTFSDLLADWTSAAGGIGYDVDTVTESVCARCGGRAFAIGVDDEAGCAERLCIACDDAVLIADSVDHWSEAEPVQCECPCGWTEFAIAVGIGSVERFLGQIRPGHLRFGKGHATTDIRIHRCEIGGGLREGGARKAEGEQGGQDDLLHGISPA